MHEFSLVRSLLAQAVTLASPAEPQHLRRIHVSTGPLAGVEPLLVQLAFDQLKRAHGLPDCQLSIEEQTLHAACRACGERFDIEDFVFRCPTCDSSSMQVTQGDEFRLLRLEVETAVDEEAARP